MAGQRRDFQSTSRYLLCSHKMSVLQSGKQCPLRCTSIRRVGLSTLLHSSLLIGPIQCFILADQVPITTITHLTFPGRGVSRGEIKPGSWGQSVSTNLQPAAPPAASRSSTSLITHTLASPAFAFCPGQLHCTSWGCSPQVRMAVLLWVGAVPSGQPLLLLLGAKLGC